MLRSVLAAGKLEREPSSLRSFTLLWLLTLDRSSFFAPKPHGNACYTDYGKHICNCRYNYVLKKSPVKCLTELHRTPQLTPGKTHCFGICSLAFTCVSKLIREVTDSNPVEVLNFFQASYAISCNCINCVHEDHSSFDFISTVLIWFISYIPGFLKTGLAKLATHSTTWQFKRIKLIQRPIKSLYLTPGSKLMVPRNIRTSPNLKWRKF